MKVDMPLSKETKPNSKLFCLLYFDPDKKSLGALSGVIMSLACRPLLVSLILTEYLILLTLCQTKPSIVNYFWQKITVYCINCLYYCYGTYLMDYNELFLLLLWRQIKMKRSPDEQPFKSVWELVHLNIVITKRGVYFFRTCEDGVVWHLIPLRISPCSESFPGHIGTGILCGG